MDSEDQIPIPDVLYKYRALSGESRAFVRQIIVENKVYFPSPESFNDPFDCRIHASFVGTNKDWKKYCTQLLKKYRPYMNRQQRQAEISRIVSTERRHRNPEILRNMLDGVQREVNGIGVFSLSARNDDILMWSYYADHHKGLCLGFLHRVGPLGPAVQVDYPSSFPQIDYLKDNQQRQMEANLLTKAASWRHEDEWRVIDTQGPGIRAYPPELLAEVIFGVRMPPEDRNEVLSWIEAHHPKPRVREAIIKDNEYGLELRDL